MQIKSTLIDKKVSANSVLIEISVREYLELAKKIYRKNNFQRRRVRSAKTVYSLLKSDILQGCVIPPVVLAYTRPVGTLEHDLSAAIKNDSEHFVLLDGLQRSLTLIEIESETISSPDIQKDFLDRMMRCEIYEGINKIGILYRMLTLNTGQTPMSVRHQIEILYQDYLDVKIDDITLVCEVDAKRARQPKCYNFKDVIEGLNSYLDRSESPLDRGDILENISSLENLAKENGTHDVFKDFIATWDKFIQKVSDFNIDIAKAGRNEDEDEDETESKVWAATGVQIFKRAQAISGFGAAIGLLRDEDNETSFQSLVVEGIEIGSAPEDFILEFNELIDSLNSRAKRIGNAQRLFFRQFFKMLFWIDSGCYLNMTLAIREAYKSANRIGI